MILLVEEIMNKVIYILADKQLRKHDFSHDLKEISLGPNVTDTFCISQLNERYLITPENEGVRVARGKDEKRIGQQGNIVFEGIKVSYREHEEYVYNCNDMNYLRFGIEGDIKTTEEFGFIDIRKKELLTTKEVYYNHQLCSGKIKLFNGDILYLNGLEIVIQEDAIITNQLADTDQLVYLGEPKSVYPDEYPDYRRSPRLIHREPEDEIRIMDPPQAITKPNEKFLRVLMTPILGAVTTLIMSLIRANPLFLLMGAITTGIGIINAVVKFFQDRKRYKVESKDRDEKYQRYLVEKTGQFEAAKKEQIFALNYHYPKVAELFELCNSYSNRIYERGVYHHDFLHIKVGLGLIKASYPIQFASDTEKQNDDALYLQAKEIKEKYEFLEKQPLIIDLNQGMVGYIGKRNVVIEQIQWLLLQLAFFHSYHDVEMISVFKEEEYNLWEPLKWLPHFQLQAFNMRGFVYHDRSKDQVLNSLNQVLKMRKQSLQERVSESRRFSPHYVIAITDEKLVIDHAIMEILSEDPIQLGVTLIHVKDVVENLSEYTKTVIDIRNEDQGVIVLENQELKNKRFYLEGMKFPIETFTRKISPLNHLLNMTNAIPERVTFLELYQVEHVEELNAVTRWHKNETYKTMAVPLGLRGKDDIVYLNLHEKAHGPHGLVAGTTGSGKSEIIQSYILSLAVHFHPYEVAFLLIDYKGGGMANLFKDLPHHLGSITNLDGSQSMRALISIKAELQRRQRLFSEYEVNHINQYQKLFKEGKTKTPMPHLFLISDEFAELKSEQPEFMKELVSTARIGRSLGIHLILATQKPSGVVDDQIWSNSKFKLCLKVQNASDSNEMLKTADAANITLPGRSYLQVGNNEIYELFQSAWSGADYISNQEDRDLLDSTVYKINELGQYEVLSEDLSGLSEEKEQTKVQTELDAIIDYLQTCADNLEIEKLPQPWLPPLEERLILTPKDYKEEWGHEKRSFVIPFSMMDLPHQQLQKEHELDFSRNGHFIVYSSPGFGKSTTLQTIVMNSARRYSPKNLHVYLFDFGTNGLLPLKKLPHVADLFTLEDKDKLVKWTKIMQKEIKERKALLSEYSVANIEMYEKASQQTLPIITIAVDNYDAVRESNFQEEFDFMLTQISREGVSLGIHLMMSATRGASVRYQLSTNFKMQLCLYMIDKSEISGIVGRSEFGIDELSGRGLMNLQIPTLMQVSLPTLGEDALEVVQNLQQEATEMDAYYEGSRPRSIPMLAEKMLYEDFMQMPEVQAISIQKQLLPIGLEEESVLPLSYNYKANPLLILSRSENHLNEKLSFVLKLLLAKQTPVYLMDDTSMMLSKYESQVKEYIYDKENVERVVDTLYEQMQERVRYFAQLVQKKGLDVAKKEFDAEREERFLVINNLSQIVGQLGTLAQAHLLELIVNQGKSNIHVVLGCMNSTVVKGYDEVHKYIKGLKCALIDTKTAESAIAAGQTILREKVPEDNMGYLIRNEQAVRVQFVSEL